MKPKKIRNYVITTSSLNRFLLYFDTNNQPTFSLSSLLDNIRMMRNEDEARLKDTWRQSNRTVLLYSWYHQVSHSFFNDGENAERLKFWSLNTDKFNLMMILAKSLIFVVLIMWKSPLWMYNYNTKIRFILKRNRSRPTICMHTTK